MRTTRASWFGPIILGLACLGAVQAHAATVRFGFGTSGSGDGQFAVPTSIATDVIGNVYVTDQTLSRVTKFDANGTYLLKWGSSGSGNGQFNFCMGIAVDLFGDVYVADMNNSRIQKFDSNGNHLLSWGSFGTGDGEFIEPIGVATSVLGDVYVVEQAGNRVQKFTGAGAFVGKWGSTGSAPGQFDTPRDIVLDSADNVYVTDRLNSRVQKFNSSGLFLLSWGSVGPDKGQFQAAAGIGVDSFQNVFVTDFTGNVVNMFRPIGTFVTRWGNGFGDVALSQPSDVAVRGNLVYVADGANDRVQVYTIGPVALEVSDIPNDQGRQVRVAFDRAYTDFNGATEAITQYEAYRLIDLTNPARVAPGLKPQLAGWDYVATIPAHGESEYSMVLPTLGDSTASGTEWTTFMIRAATASPYVFFDSEPESAYSVDNLAPSAPLNFQVTQVTGNGSVVLEWDANGEIDLHNYDLHRGTTPGFVPSEATRIAEVTETMFLDPQGATVGFPVYYKLSARDHAGNESDYALANTEVIEVDGDAMPRELALFVEGANPATEFAHFRLELTAESSATLEIYDVLGRRVWQSARTTYPAGRSSVTWDLRAGSGMRVGAGLYFARLVTPQGYRSARIAVGN